MRNTFLFFGRSQESLHRFRSNLVSHWCCKNYKIFLLEYIISLPSRLEHIFPIIAHQNFRREPYEKESDQRLPFFRSFFVFILHPSHCITDNFEEWPAASRSLISTSRWPPHEMTLLFRITGFTPLR